MGVWLPLALADIQITLIALCRLWCSNPGDVKVPSRSKVLGSWALPMLAKSMEADEKEQAALELLRSVQSLAAKYPTPDPSPPNPSTP